METGRFAWLFSRG